MIALLCAMWLAVTGPDLEPATNAYREGRYQEAFALFEATLADTETPAGPVLFAMGNCAFRSSDFARAALCYRRALLRLPDHPRIAFNLQLAERRLGVIEVRPSPVQAALDWTAELPIDALALTAALLEALGVAGFVVLRRNVIGRGVAIACVAVGVLGALRVVQLDSERATPEGVVMRRQLAVHTEPHADLPVTVVLRAGTTVHVLEGSDRWLHVSCPAGEGWAERTGVGIVD